ncbi:MAG: hypothetical protein AAF492_20195 [Verrucomicrobiota bacterium]
MGLDAATGQEIFLVSSGARTINTQPVVLDNRLIASTSEETLIFDRETSNLVQTIDMGGELSFHDDTLYIASADRNPSAYALSSPPAVPLNLSVNDPDRGRIEALGAWKHHFPSGTVVSITAVPESYFDFRDWSGDLSSTQATLNLVMNTQQTLRAVFVPQIVTNNVPLWWLAA